MIINIIIINITINIIIIIIVPAPIHATDGHGYSERQLPAPRQRRPQYGNRFRAVGAWVTYFNISTFTLPALLHVDPAPHTLLSC